MTAAAILPRLRAAGADVALRDGRLIVSKASLVPPDLMTEAKSRRSDLLSELANDNAAHADRPFVDDRIERAAIQAEGLPVQRLRKRMMSWARADDGPQLGDFCGGCEGQLWWAESENPRGWRCAWCHPPAHLRPDEIRTTAT